MFCKEMEKKVLNGKVFFKNYLYKHQVFVLWVQRNYLYDSLVFMSCFGVSVSEAQKWKEEVKVFAV